MIKFFGADKDESVLADSTRLAMIGTCIFWAVIILLSALLPVSPHPELYKTVQITLSEPVVSAVPAIIKPEIEQKKTPEVSIPEKSVKTRVDQKTAGRIPEAPAVKKHSVARSVPVEPSGPVAYGKSVDDMMAAQHRTASSQKTQWDDTVFDGSAVAVTSAAKTATPQKIIGASALSGTSAEAAVPGNDQLVSGSPEAGKKSQVQNASDSTKSALGKIAATTYTQSAGNGTSSQVSVHMSGTDGKVALEMSDGSARVLLDPPKPVIFISKDNAALIDSSRTVTVQFKVLAGGNVPLSGIEIKPSSALPLPILSEIREQIASWRFATDSADGIARFEYSIIKK
jgi:hypothetical protein